MKASFSFRATAHTVLEMACEAIGNGSAATASFTKSSGGGSANSGTLYIDALTEDELQKAQGIIQNDPLFSKHFSRKV